jgi:shikimate kinase
LRLFHVQAKKNTRETLKESGEAMTSTESTTQPNDTTGSAASPAIPAHLKRLVLTGFMGAGKSTIGRLLADRLNWNFLDLDAHLEARTGATIPQLFAEHGEARFRRLESTALASALARTNTVLALGGGTPEDLADPAAAQLRFERRHPLYRRLAGLTIVTANQTPAQTVDALLAGAFR